MMEFDVLIQL